MPSRAPAVGKNSRGYDAGKKINGRKRFIVTDTAGLLITVAVLAASWQDRDGGKTALLGMYLISPVGGAARDEFDQSLSFPRPHSVNRPP